MHRRHAGCVPPPAAPPVALLHLLHQGVHWQQAAHAEDEVVDELIRRLTVQQRANDLQVRVWARGGREGASDSVCQ